MGCPKAASTRPSSICLYRTATAWTAGMRFESTRRTLRGSRFHFWRESFAMQSPSFPSSGTDGHVPAPNPESGPWGSVEMAAMLESAGVGIWATDLDGKCVFINDYACRTLGYPREKCLGRHIHGMVQA